MKFLNFRPFLELSLFNFQIQHFLEEASVNQSGE